MDDFFRQKICWKAVGRNLAFSLVEPGIYLTAPASFILSDTDNDYIIAFLCSNLGKYFIYQNSDTTGAGDIMLNIQSLIKLPITIETDNKAILKQLVNSIIQNKKLNIDYKNQELKINEIIYDIFDFTDIEIKYLENKII